MLPRNGDSLSGERLLNPAPIRGHEAGSSLRTQLRIVSSVAVRNDADHQAARLDVIADFETLKRLVGRERPSAVRKWLEKQGIRYWLNADGRPVTTERALNDALFRRRRTEPNFAAMREFSQRPKRK